VLRHVDLELRPEETVALVGATGSGKSTLASLLLGLAVPTDGCITVGGRNLDPESLSAWRSCVAWVPQRSTLFRGTIADNIRLGAPDADDERVRGAARLAGADDFVGRLPEGYETLVGDGGRPLSAGETQRIALARAFIRDAPFVVLDEPTANLDPANARAVWEALVKLALGRTTLVIAHRPELAERADRVVRLVGGRISEERQAA
jgi:ABC-type multidrug transport system fused ATPase/permease subunit